MKRLILIFVLFMIVSLLSMGDEAKKPAKKLYPLNISQGELFNDFGEGVEFSLSEENAVKEGGLSIKITFKSGASCGMWNPPRSNWSDFNFLKMVWFNPNKEIVSLNFSVRDDSKKRDYSTRWDNTIVLKPGKNVITIPLQGVTNNSGEPFNLKKITHWFIYCPTAKPEKPVTVYFCDFYLTTEEE